MARVRKEAGQAEATKKQAEAVLNGRRLLGPLSKPKNPKLRSSRGISARVAERQMREIDEKIEAEAYSEMSARDYVALYCWMYEAIYDLSCVEEVRPEWNVAASSASKMLKDEFEGDEQGFLEFIRWAAKREEERELWRRKNGRSGGRLTWRHLFMFKSTLADWRLDKARREGVQ